MPASLPSSSAHGRFLPRLLKRPPHPAQRSSLCFHKATKGDWTGWYFRARVREQSMTSAKLTPEYLAEYQRQLLQVIQEQARHHLTKGEGRNQTYEPMEVATLIFFALTALACLARLMLPQLRLSEDVLVLCLTTMGAVTAALPAIGAALEGLQAQGEYQRLTERADGMSHFFTSIQSRLTTPEPKQLSYTELAQSAHQVSGAMLDELSDWRNLVRVRSFIRFSIQQTSRAPESQPSYSRKDLRRRLSVFLYRAGEMQVPAATFDDRPHKAGRTL
jgi:hypothetical protein